MNLPNTSHPGDGRRTLRDVIPFIGLLVGICIVAYPAVSDYLERLQAEHQITHVKNVMDVTSDPNHAYWLNQAVQYNKLIAGVPDYQEPEGGLLPYERQLSYRANTCMSWIQIPKIGLRLPVYHGTTDEVLAAGIGHLDSTSLPVGGESSSCILEGHSGIRRCRMFDDIRDLNKGDVLCLWTLSEPYAYKVEGVSIVNPDDVLDLIPISSGHDKLFLVTCTTCPDALHPRGRVGINDKRLVVECSRTEYDPSLFEHDDDIISNMMDSSRIRPFVIVTAVLLSILAIAGARKIWKHVMKPKAEGDSGVF